MKGREKKLFHGRATQNTLAVTTNLGVDWKISLAKLYYVQPPSVAFLSGVELNVVFKYSPCPFCWISEKTVVDFVVFMSSNRGKSHILVGCSI